MVHHHCHPAPTMPPDDADDARRLIEETARASAEAVARRLAETRLGPDQQRHT